MYTPTLTGIDIQLHEIRLMQLRKTKSTFIIENIAKVMLPNSIFTDGKIKNWRALQTVMTEQVRVLGLKGAAAVTLPANLVRMQRLSLPTGLSDTAIQEEITAQVQRDLPGVVEALSIDYTAVATAQAPYADVYFAAARQDYVSQLVQCVNQTGLQVKIVDVDIYALKRWVHFATAMPMRWGEVYALVYVCQHWALLLVYNSHEIFFHQQWEISANDLIAELKNRFQMCLAAFHHLTIHKLIVCGMEDCASVIEAEVYYPDLLASFKQSKLVDNVLLAQQTADFLIAGGAAMQEVPRW
jgi:type IV pilus assembly protein PilM